MLAEAAFSRIESVEKMSYVRGFTGFSQQSFNKQFIIDFSKNIEREIGPK